MKLSHIIVLLLIVGGIYAAINYSTKNIALIPDAPTLDSLKGMDPGNYILVDSRPNLEYLHGAASRAINLDEEDFNTGYMTIMGNWVPGNKIIVYDDQDHQYRANEVAKKLLARNLTGVYVLTGGVESFNHLVAPKASNEFRQF